MKSQLASSSIDDRLTSIWKSFEIKYNCLYLSMDIFNRILKHTIILTSVARDFKEHLDRVEKDEEEKKGRGPIGLGIK